MKAWFPILLLLVVAASGCLGGDDLDEEKVGGGNGKGGSGGGDTFKLADANPLEEQLEAIEVVAADDPDWDRPNVTKDDWLLVSTPVDAQGQVAAFKWDFPTQGLSADGALNLDIAPAMGPMGKDELAEDEEWIFMVVVERYDEQMGWESQTTGSLTRYGYTSTTTIEGIDGNSESTSLPSYRPFRFTINYDEETYSNTIYFILAARGSGGEFGLGVRISERGSASDNWDAFESAVGDEPPYVPERVLTGTGLHMASYRSDYVVGQGITTTRTLDAPEPQESLPDAWRPFLGARSTSLSTGVDWGGWSDVRFAAVSQAEVGQLDLAFDVHGHSEMRTYVLTGTATPEDLPGAELQYPAVNLRVDGGEPASISTELTRTGGLAGSDLLSMHHFSIGVQIEEVTGLSHRDSVIIL